MTDTKKKEEIEAKLKKQLEQGLNKALTQLEDTLNFIQIPDTSILGDKMRELKERKELVESKLSALTGAVKDAGD